MDNFYEKSFWGNSCIAKEKIRGFENHLITKGRTKNTTGQYRNVLKVFFVDYLRDKPIEQVTKEDVEGFIPWKIKLETERHKKNLVGRGCGRIALTMGELKPATINSLFSALRKYFCFYQRFDLADEIEFAKTKKWVPPVFEIDLPKIINLFKSRNLSELEDMTRKALVAGRKSKEGLNEFYVRRNALLFYLLFNTGIRIGEAANLTKQSFKFDLATPAVMVDGKTGQRTFSLTPDLVEKIRGFLVRENISDALFCSTTGAKLSVNTLKTYIWRMFRLGLGEEYHAHTLRHAYITFMVDKGVSLKIIGNNVGHSSVAMTSIYVDTIKGRNESPISPMNFIETT